MDQDQQERIRQRAHEIWESEGRPEGRDSDHWNQAQEELRNQFDDEGQTSDTAAEPELAKKAKPAAKRSRKPKAEPTPYLNDGP